MARMKYVSKLMKSKNEILNIIQKYFAEEKELIESMDGFDKVQLTEVLKRIQEKHKNDEGEVESKLFGMMADINYILLRKSDLIIKHVFGYNSNWIEWCEIVDQDEIVPYGGEICCNKCAKKCHANKIPIDVVFVRNARTNKIDELCKTGVFFCSVPTKTFLEKRKNIISKEWAEKIKKRDGYKCILCGNTEKLNAHHLCVDWAHNKYRYDLRNGITLCMNCHIILHRMIKNKEQEIPIYEHRNEKLIIK